MEEGAGGHEGAYEGVTAGRVDVELVDAHCPFLDMEDMERMMLSRERVARRDWLIRCEFAT